MSIARAALLGATLLSAGAASGQREPPPTVLTTSSGVVDGARDGTNAWFYGWTPTIGFLLSSPDPDSAAARFKLLAEASRAATAVVIRFDPASGRYDPSHNRIMYRACAVTGAGSAGASEAACPADASGAAVRPAERALALGVALAEANKSRQALPWLDEALAGNLHIGRRLIALRARQGAREGQALLLPRSPARDEALAGALSDARAWATLAPDDADAEFAAASMLTQLGGYDEALQAYRRIAERWPQEDYRASVRVGAIRRGQGDYPAALAALDGLVKRHGPQTGMRFHYHRGWTLTLLRRDEEAVAELTAGLKGQPDYSWALVRRACALGRLGRVREAAADQRAAIVELDKLRPALGDLNAEATADLARARAVRDQLERAAARETAAPTEVACVGYSDPDAKRSRSPLLR